MNDIRISQMMKSKDDLSIKKYIMKSEKKLASSLNKISGFRYKSKNATILGHSGLQFLAINLDENAAILGQSDVFVPKEFK